MLTIKETENTLKQIGTFETPVLATPPIENDPGKKFGPLHFELIKNGHHNFLIGVFDNMNAQVTIIGSIHKFDQFRFKINDLTWYFVPENARQKVITTMMNLAMTPIDKRKDYTTSADKQEQAHQYRQKQAATIIANRNASIKGR